VAFECDVASAEAVKATFTKIFAQTSNTVDILVNSAGNNIAKRGISLISCVMVSAVMLM